MTMGTPEMLQLKTADEAAEWLRERVVGSLHSDSRQVQPGDAFIAWPGAVSDARAYVGAALAKGAAACVVEQDGAAKFGLTHPAVASFAGLKAACGPIAAAYFGQPAQALDVIAVTGTNGKTSTAWWLAQALEQVNLANELLRNRERTPQVISGLVGTLGLKIPPTAKDQQPQMKATGLTTPDPVTLQTYLYQLAQAGSRYCVLEASSIGLAEHRLAGTPIRVAIFTNFTQDHLDYHGSMEGYWQSKAALFAWPGLQAAVVNTDDTQGLVLEASLAGRGLDVWTVSCQHAARLQAQGIDYGAAGLHFSVCEGAQSVHMQTALIGHYNVANLLGVLAALRALGVPLAAAVEACSHLTPVPGRMQCLGQPGQPLAVVDYAHTPDALDKALTALRPLAQSRGGRLWCVLGCGGERDRSKRPLMAAMAEKHADQVVVTSDNPRGERPEAIICQMLLGLSHRESVHVQADRARAIAQTMAEAAATDVVLIAGEGHEEVQEIAGVKQPFSDVAHAQAALAHRAAKLGVATC